MVEIFWKIFLAIKVLFDIIKIEQSGFWGRPACAVRAGGTGHKKACG